MISSCEYPFNIVSPRMIRRVFPSPASAAFAVTVFSSRPQR
jgi:hypothetical protein